MSEQYSVEAVLSVIDQGFTQAMQRADAMTNNLNSSSGKSAGGIGKLATSFGIGQIAANVATSAFNTMTNAVGTITGEMNDNAKAWKTFEGNMTMIGKSETEINKVRSSLQDFATQTIYSASDMASTYGQMAAIGVADTEKLVRGMGGLAASAENPAQAMKSMSQQMVQAMAQPEMKWQDFRIMMDQAPAAMAQVAQEMGYSLDELIVAIQDGEVASKDFAEAMATVGTNDHFSQLATTAMTVDQAMDGLVETLANKLEPAFNIASQMGINAIETFTDWIDAIDFSPMISGLETVAELFGVITPEVESMTDTVAMSADEIQTLADSWEGLTLSEKQAKVDTMGQEDIESLMQILGVDFESLPNEYHKNAYLNAYGADALEEVLFLTGEWANLTFEEKRAILETQIDNAELREAIETRDLWNNEEFYGQLADIDMSDNDAEQQILDLINQWGELEGLEPIEMEVDAKKAVTAVDDITGSFKNLDKATSNKLFNNISRQFGKIGDAVKGIDFESIFEVGMQSIELFGEVVENVFTFLGDFTEPIFDGIGDVIVSSLNHWENMVRAFGKALNGDWEGAWNDVKSTFETTWDDLVGIGQTMATDMWSNITQAFDNGVSFLGDVGGKIKNWIFTSTGAQTWSDVSEWIFDGIGQGWETAVSYLGNVSEKMRTWIFEKVGADSWSDVASKIIEMISSGISGVTTAFTSITNKIREKMASYLSSEDWQETAKAIIDGIASVFEGFGYLVGGIAGALVAKLAPELSSQGYNESGQAIIDGIVSALWDAPRQIAFALLDGLAGGLMTELSKIDLQGMIDNLIRKETPKGSDPAEAPAGTGAFGAGAGQAKNPLEGMDAKTQTSMDNMISIIQRGYQSINTATNTFIANLNGTVATNTGHINSTVDSSMQALYNSISQSLNSVDNRFTAIMNSINAGVDSGMADVQSTVSSTMSAVIASLNATAGPAYSAGVATGAGFQNGLASMRASIVNTATGIANAASAAINRALIVRSPSRKGFYSGSMLGKGVYLGMEDEKDSIEQMAHTLGELAVPNIAPFEASSFINDITGNELSVKHQLIAQQSEAQTFDDLRGEIREVVTAIREGQIVMLDGDSIIGRTIERYDDSFGQKISEDERWVLG